MHSLLRYVAVSAAAISCAAPDPALPLDDFPPTSRATADAGRESEGEAPLATGDDAGGKPVPICNAMDFGAKRDGKSNDTRALQSAIDACAKGDRGGVVLLEGGTFLSGTIRLADRITLRVAKGATLLGSREDRDYPELVVPTDNSQLSNCKRALVYAGNAHDVRIEGEGTIDGNADIPKWRGGTVAESSRPMAIFAALSERVTIEGIRVRNAATWAVVGLETSFLTIRGLDVTTDLGPTHDGIDVVDGHDIVIEGCTVRSGDDSICLKSGSPKGLRRVVVKNCRTTRSGVANGLKLGTASRGAFEDIVFEDIRISDAQAAAIAVESVDGAAISNVTFRRIEATNTGTPFFVLLGRRGNAPIGTMRSVLFEKVRSTGARYPWGSLVSGAPPDVDGRHDLEGVVFRDVDVAFVGKSGRTGPRMFGPGSAEAFPEYTGAYPDAKFVFATKEAKQETLDYALPAWGFFVRHATDVRFERCRANVTGTDDRKWLATKNATTFGVCTP